MTALSEFIRACEKTWARLQQEFPDVPDAVIVVGSGGRSASYKYGHFLKDGWTANTGEVQDVELDDDHTVKLETVNRIHEVLIVAEQLSRPDYEVFRTLIHEAVHGIAVTRGIKDVSGKRHNKRFARLCEEVGMIPPEKPDDKLGYSGAELSEELVEQFGPEIEMIAEAQKLCRNLNFETAPRKKTSWTASCECERKIRLGKKVLEDISPEAIGIDCGICGAEFKVEDYDED